MKSRAIAVLLATVAMYVWGFLYWGVNPLPYRTWQQTTDDVAAGKALLALLPTSGTYYIPSPRNDDDTLSQLFEAGPLDHRTVWHPSRNNVFDLRSNHE